MGYSSDTFIILFYKFWPSSEVIPGVLQKLWVISQNHRREWWFYSYTIYHENGQNRAIIFNFELKHYSSLKQLWAMLLNWGQLWEIQLIVHKASVNLFFSKHLWVTQIAMEWFRTITKNLYFYLENVDFRWKICDDIIKEMIMSSQKLWYFRKNLSAKYEGLIISRSWVP